MNDTEIELLAAKTIKWIASEAGRRALSEALDAAKHSTLMLQRARQVKPESLHEPMTI